MPVAPLENFDTEEALTIDVPFPQDATTSLSLNPSTLQLPDAMLYETMVYRSSLVQGVNYNQTLESLPLPLPLQLDVEPRLTTLHEQMAKQPEQTRSPATEGVPEERLTILHYSPISKNFERPDKDPRLKGNEVRAFGNDRIS
jgi:hypothetical protein